MTHAPRAARTIAAGGNPPWEGTFTHPVHGELTFKGKLPLAIDSLRHSVEVDNQLAELDSEPSVQTMILAAALAGLSVPDPVNAPGKALLLTLPIISEEVTPSADGGPDVIVRHYYNAEAEADPSFLQTVWLGFSNWRQSLLSDTTVRAVGESSGDPSTTSDASSTPSDSATGSPPPTTAS